VFAFVRVCVCETERERKRGRERVRVRVREKEKSTLVLLQFFSAIIKKVGHIKKELKNSLMTEKLGKKFGK
jgi:hypothetical protein